MSEAEVIARLYRQIKELEEERDAVLLTYNQADGECARLRRLVARAADALEDSLPMKQYASQFKLPYFDLIVKLRKAAE